MVFLNGSKTKLKWHTCEDGKILQDAGHPQLFSGLVDSGEIPKLTKRGI